MVTPSSPVEAPAFPGTSAAIVFAPPSSTAAAASVLRILLVEDSPVNQKIAVGMLHRLGHVAAIADDGRAALALLQKKRFDLVFMDVEMPEMDGPEATRELRALLPRPWQPVVVAVTAHTDRTMHDRLIAGGMDACLTKPLQIGELAKILVGFPELLAQRLKAPRLSPPAG
jgi:CheY-like chemotaxis protein